jgi:hypothetical protein
MPSVFASFLAAASQETSKIRAELAHVDTITIGAASNVRDRCALAKAFYYVWLEAILEDTVKNSFSALLGELNAAAVPQEKLRTSLFSLLCEPELDSISDRKRHSSWPNRISLFSRLVDKAPATFNQSILPLDNRTLRGEHFDTIWLVLGLPGTSLPSPLHRVALSDLAEGRNDVAHGAVQPIVFGKAKATIDMLNLVGRVEDVVSHYLAALEDYLGKQQFSR